MHLDDDLDPRAATLADQLLKAPAVRPDAVFMPGVDVKQLFALTMPTPTVWIVHPAPCDPAAPGSIRTDNSASARARASTMAARVGPLGGAGVPEVLALTAGPEPPSVWRA